MTLDKWCTVFSRIDIYINDGSHSHEETAKCGGLKVQSIRGTLSDELERSDDLRGWNLVLCCLLVARLIGKFAMLNESSDSWMQSIGPNSTPVSISVLCREPASRFDRVAQRAGRLLVLAPAAICKLYPCHGATMRNSSQR